MEWVKGSRPKDGGSGTDRGRLDMLGFFDRIRD